MIVTGTTKTGIRTSQMRKTVTDAAAVGSNPIGPNASQNRHGGHQRRGPLAQAVGDGDGLGGHGAGRSRRRHERDTYHRTMGAAGDAANRAKREGLSGSAGGA